MLNKLRCAIRIGLPEGKHGINDNGDISDMKSIEEKVTAFRKWLLSNKHRKKIFADPIPVVGPDGDIRNIQPQRIIFWKNFSGMESARTLKKTGMASLNKVLQSILA